MDKPAVIRRGLLRRGMGALLVLALTAAAAPADGADPAGLRPCPTGAGWERLSLSRLPRRDGSGERAGGFSAVLVEPDGQGVLLLSDGPQGWLALAQLGGAEGGPRLTGRRPLRSGPAAALPAAMDGEAMVRRGASLWLASEGRRTPERPPQLLRVKAASGELEQVLDLPADWQAGPGRGLAANGGPEALALLRRTGQADALLMAAETPLLQDPPGQVRLLAWSLATDPPVAQPLAPLRLPWGPWGLTDLLAVTDGRGGTALLALLRRFEPPDRWGARLALYPLPAAIPAAAAADPRTRAVPPLASWDLLAAPLDLPADNWEGLAAGPPLPDGRPTLVLVSDDNFSAFQDNVLAVLAPLRLSTCSPLP